MSRWTCPPPGRTLWTTLSRKVATGNRPELVDYVNNVVYPVNSFHGKDLPVSTFENYADGTSPQGTAAYEKRGVAVDVPEWIAGQLHPVQPVLLCVSPCGHPSHRS